jgi:hypothetical protein
LKDIDQKARTATFAKIASMQSIIAEWSFGPQLLERMIEGIAINEHSDRSHSLVAAVRAFSIAQATEHGATRATKIAHKNQDGNLSSTLWGSCSSASICPCKVNGNSAEHTVAPNAPAAAGS